MRIARMIARAELRRRWSSLLALTALVAFAGAAVLTALVGAHRTSTVLDRFRSWANSSDVSYQTSDPAQGAPMLAAARALPGVEAAATRSLVNAFPVDESIPDLAVMTDPEGTYGYALDRPRLLAGRLPARDAPEELALNELAARLTGLEVGDRVQVRTWTSDDLSALFAGSEFPGFNGPEIEFRIVGVGRTAEELPGDVARTTPYAIASPAFLAAYPGIGAWPPAAFLRLRAGTDLAAVDAAMAPFQEADVAPSEDQHYSSGTTAREVYLDTSEQTARSLAVGLAVFAAGAALAGAVAVGQAVTRELAATSDAARLLGALGLPRRRVAWALALPVAGAGMLGAGLACVLAVLSSPLLPVGLSRRAEVDRGIWVDPAVLAAGSVVTAAAVAAWAFVSARRAQRRAPAAAPGRRQVTMLARSADGLGAVPAVRIGVRLAGDRGRGAGAVPVWSTQLAAALGIAAVVAAGLLSANVTRLQDTPGHWGWTWSTMPDYFGDGDLDEVADRLRRDERVEAVALLGVGSAVFGDRATSTFAVTELAGEMPFTVLDGRAPERPDEVAFGRQTMDDLGVSIGESVEGLTTGGAAIRRLEVVGTAVLPPTENRDLDVGALVTADGLEALAQDAPLVSVVLRYPPGADAAGLERALNADYDLQFNVFTQAQVPGSIRNLGEGRNVGVALAAFFAALAAAGLFHALLVSTRIRARDLAVLRAFGFRRREVRAAVLVQGLVVTLVGTALGVPAGLIVGRFVWRALVERLGVVADPVTPWLFVVAVGLGAAVVAAAVAWGPGRSAVRRGPADQLRAE